MLPTTAIRMMGGLAVVAFAGVTLGWTPATSAVRMAGKENPVSAIQIFVTGGEHNKPIDNASVYLRYDEPRFLLHPRHIELDLKTDQAGIAKVNDVPRVKILIQVVKDGWRPFGQYYVLEKEQEKIEIHMKPPAHWY
ncbi:MAG: hypothetical protein ACRD4V_13045 [Candidatus Acidiferrales bacterium]